MNPIYEKIREDLENHEKSKIRGLSTRDVVSQSYSEADIKKLVEQLKDEPFDFLVPFRLTSFIWERQQDRIPENLRERAADYAADRISGSNGQMLTELVSIFVCWGPNRKDHRQKCCDLLNHSNGEVREIALRKAAVFLRRSEYPILFKFREDPSYGETMGMGGPLRFTIRDEALSVLERLTGAPKSVGDCFEEKPQGRVSYRSWASFLNWFEKHKRNFRD